MTRHIQQSNSYSCFGVCAAMALDVSFSKVIKIVGHDGSEKNFSPEEIKKFLGFVGQSFRKTTDLPGSLRGKRLFIEVISNEAEGHTHIIYWDGYYIHDPVKKCSISGGMGWGVVAIYEFYYMKVSLKERMRICWNKQRMYSQ